jgi:hypothetical protein
MGRITAALLLFLAACSGSKPATVALTDGGADADVAAGQCRRAFSLGDGGPGACHVGKRNLQCISGEITCACVADGDGCDGCPGATCHDVCNANEYAAACGGPPVPDASFQYTNPPEVCRTVGVTPAGSAFYCCPCQ